MIDSQSQDDLSIYVWGPPCQPYSKLNGKRKEGNPLLEKNARPFLLGSEYIRTLAAI